MFRIVITFLPLVPVLFIIGRKLYLQEPLNYLAVICLLEFLEGVQWMAYPLNKEEQFLTDKLFSLVLFLLFIQAFRFQLKNKLRYGLDLSLTAVVSVVLTFWSIKGWQENTPGISLLLNGFTTIVILLCLPAVVRHGQLLVFQSPLFWIGGGTLFYLLLSLLLAGISFGNSRAPGLADPEKQFFLELAGLAKYMLYTVAALSYRQPQEDGQGS
jgi:hypothetical protein